MIQKPYRLIQGDCLEILRDPTLPKVDCIFADPPDNIGLDYNEFSDKLSPELYVRQLREWVNRFMQSAPIVWISFNARWTFEMGHIFADLLNHYKDWEGKPCVQVFTFGQHRQTDLGNNHRPLWRLKHKDAPLYPDQIRVPSWRQRHGDKRADGRGRVPGDVLDFQYPWMGDVMDFPRVTGNSKQRCDWHPTQLHEDLVERCIKLSTVEGDHVLDPFGGTGTTLRVCRKIERRCTLIEIDSFYCKQLKKEHGIPIE